MAQDNTESAPIFAAIDLGSNSFHMIVARLVDGQLQVLDRLRDMVRLAAGLDEQNRLAADAQQRALECLERFGERLNSLPPRRIRVVGTNTLRTVRGSRDFLRASETALGHPIEVVSGAEEARLIYLGVAHTTSVSGRQSTQRAPVFAGAVAILSGVFESLAIDTMAVSSGALREGLIFDLVGRSRNEDARGRTVANLVRRYTIDVAHARRVARTALDLFAQVSSDWELDAEDLRWFLEWSAVLHEIGLSISAETIALEFPEGWLDARPMTLADLEQERAYLNAANLDLRSCQADAPLH